MNCVLVSFFNSHNIGDCIIADVLHKMTSAQYDTEKFSYSGNPHIITDINDIRSTNPVNNNNSKRKYIYDVLKKYHLTLLISLYRMLKRKNSHYAEFESKICNADVLVIGGGNMIFDTSKYSNSALRFNEYISIAKKHKIKVFVVSIGIGPFVTKQQEKNTVEALEKCDYITFRDQKSYDIYAKHSNNLDNVFVTIDPVFNLPYSIKPYVSNDIKIGLNVFNSKLIGDREEKYRQLIEGYIKLVQELTEKIGIKIVLFSTDLTDYEAVYDVYNNLLTNQNVSIREINGFDQLIELYSEISVLIGTRMHSMIIAFTQHIPIIGLSWQPKVDALFDIIDSEDCIYKYNDAGICTDTIIACCKRKLDNLKLEKGQIKEKLDFIRKNRNIDSNILSRLSQTSCKETKKN